MFINDCHVPSRTFCILHQRFTLDKLTPYLRLASLFPFLIALSTTACFFLASCVIIFMRSTSFLVNGFIVNFIIPYLKLLLFLLGHIILAYTLTGSRRTGPQASGKDQRQWQEAQLQLQSLFLPNCHLRQMW